MKKTKSTSDAWYTQKSVSQDVVLSSRARLARNLASFPFPNSLKEDDTERVQSIIFDAFTKIENPENYQTLLLNNVNPLALKVLRERSLCNAQHATGLVTSSDGTISCLINENDHLKLSALSSGLKLEKVYEKCNSIDLNLQEFIEFAASYDFGYLNSNLFDLGSGLKLSVRLHLPSLTYSKDLINIINDYSKKGIIFANSFAPGGLFESACGAYYDVYTTSSNCSTEIDVLANMSAFVKHIIQLERKKREFYADNRKTIVHNFVLRAYSLAKFSILLNFNDAVDIISLLKWGVDTKIISGIDDARLNALLYEIQSGHLIFLIEHNSFDFENDIKDDDELKEQRLRAIYLQKEIKNLDFVS